MAGVSRSTGYPNYQSDSTSGFIPEIWSGKLVKKFYKTTVFAEISNTDYEGEIKSQGDTVIIRKTPDIVVFDYVIGQGLKYQNPTSSKVELSINKAKAFAFECNNVVKHQSDVNLMDDWSNDASEKMRIAIDRDILANVYADAATANQGATAGAVSGSLNLGASGSPRQISASNVLELLLDIGLAMDEQEIPEEGRWVVLPSWICRMIKSSELRQAYVSGDNKSTLRTGNIGAIDNLTIYKTNNYATSADGGQTVSHVIAGIKAGLAFASQMTEMDEMANPNDFGRLVRGLNVYGYKVIEPKYIFHARVYK